MRVVQIGILVLLISCGEQLLEKPEGLIPREKMVEILTDMAIVNAAKSTDISALKAKNIDPTAYVFTKHGIDSMAFAESDVYYASLPAAYEAIYTEVEARLEKEKKKWEEIKKVNDSIKAVERTQKKSIQKEKDEKKE
ncbi:MAG: DUF4296 domain-containing protein [Bacteroidota bacterium]